MKVSQKIVSLAYRKCTKLLSGRGLRKIHLLRALHEQTASYIRKNGMRVQGHIMLPDATNCLGLFDGGVYEPFETKLIKKNISKGDVVIDVGAHVGYYTLIFARIVGKRGKVFAFEPDPENFRILKKNVSMNGYKNVVLINKAVSNKTGKVKLYLCKENAGDHRIFDSHDNRESIKVDAIRLDDYFKDYHGKINIIKNDSQGAEGAVIEGMPNILKKNQKLKLFIEFWPFGLSMCGTNPENFLKMLLKSGFAIWKIDEKAQKLRTVDPVMLTKANSIGKTDHTNIYCART